MKVGIRARATGAAKRQQAYRIVGVAGTGTAWVFGMTWRPVLGQDLRKAGAKSARAARASHYTQGGERSPVVGYMQAHGKDRRVKTRNSLYSAAAAFAQLHQQGVHVSLAELPQGEIWLAVVADGLIQEGGDLVLADAVAAQEKLAALRDRYKALQVHASGVTGAQPFTLTDLAGHRNSGTAVRRASVNAWVIPPHVWLIILVSIAYAGAELAFDWWEEKRAAERARLAAAGPVHDPELLWTLALEKWAQGIAPHGNTGLARLLGSVANVPTRPGRWTLVDIECLLGSGWCKALYKRAELGSTTSLATALPQSWQVEFPEGLDTARVTWKIPSPVEPFGRMQLDQLVSPSSMHGTWMPHWQAVAPASTVITLSKPERVVISVPNIRLPNGLEQPVERPAKVKLPSKQKLTLQAPMRTLYAVSLPPAMTVEKFSLFYQPETMPGLTASELTAHLEGTIYVQ